MDYIEKIYVRTILMEAFSEMYAYHGSSSDFDHFDHDTYLSTGCGSQVFGYGTYVTNDKSIGLSYAKVTQGVKLDVKSPKDLEKFMPQTLKGKFEDNELKRAYNYLRANDFYIDIAKKDVADTLEKIKNDKRDLPSNYAEIYKTISVILNSLQYEEKPVNPTVYHVEIPDDNGENYMPWYQMIPQSEMLKILYGLRNLGPEKLAEIGRKDYRFRNGLGSYLSDIRNSDKIISILSKEKDYSSFLDGNPNPNGNGSEIYRKLSQWLGSDKEASKFLNSCGFIGIKYPTGTIWKKPDGAKSDGENYVIFDSSKIKILNKEKV